MSTFFVDTHCHLDLVENIQLNPSKENDPEIKSITVTNAPFLYDHNAALFNGLDNIRVAVGLHPELVSKFAHQIGEFEKAIMQTKYVGEIGLDGSGRFSESYELQVTIFRKVLHLAAATNNKILTVHSRNAASDTIRLIDEYLAQTNCKTILHWYTGDLKSLKKAVEIGCYFSINHQMVSSKKGRELILSIPKSKLLTETDAPFSYTENIKTRIQSLSFTVDSLSKVLGLSFDNTKELIFSNFKRLLSDT